MESDIEGKLRKRCESILESYKEGPVKDAFSTLIILLNNILKKPTDQNMRLFKKTNNAIKMKILSIKECIDLLKEIGYVDLDSEFMVYEGADLNNIKVAVRVLEGSLEMIKKKIQEQEELNELKRLEDVKRENEHIQKKFREDKLRKLEIQKQIDNDKREKAQMEKPSDSVSRSIEYGAKVCKFEPQQGKRG